MAEAVRFCGGDAVKAFRPKEKGGIPNFYLQCSGRYHLYQAKLSLGNKNNRMKKYTFLQPEGVYQIGAYHPPQLVNDALHSLGTDNLVAAQPMKLDVLAAQQSLSAESGTGSLE